MKIVSECFLPWQENWPNASSLINNKVFEEKVDSMGVVGQDRNPNEFAIIQLHVMKL